jgi:hypothetical protein
MNRFHTWLFEHGNSPAEFWMVVVIILGALVFVTVTPR